jgi:hypothetical protein
MQPWCHRQAQSIIKLTLALYRGWLWHPHSVGTRAVGTHHEFFKQVTRGAFPMQTHRFGRKIKLPATIAIKHQIRQLMFEDLVKKAEAEARAEVFRGQPSEGLLVDADIVSGPNPQGVANSEKQIANSE